MTGQGLGLEALVTHARETPSEARESFADAAASLAGDPHAIVLRTCHRVEIYVAGDAADMPGLPPLPAGGRRLAGSDAVRHLLAVAAGLDSIAVGEDQILHQVRACLAGRHHPTAAAALPTPAGTRADDGSAAPDPVLERLFQVALQVGRRTRAWRDGPPRSLSDVAIDRLESMAGPVAGLPLLVVGAGRMARLATLAAARRGARVQISNRTVERASTLAAAVDGLAVPYGPGAPLPDVRGVVIALAGRWDLGPDSAGRLIAEALPIVDLSSPPALDPWVRAAIGARYLSVDDLARGSRDELRAGHRRRIERLIDEAEAEFVRWLAGRTAVPAILALTERAETRRATEVERLLRRMPDLEAHEVELVEQMSRRLVAGLLHAPLATLRDDETGDRERAARELFAL